MKLLRCAFFAVIVAASACAGTVNQALLNLVMPDSTILCGAQVDQMTASPLGQYVLSQFQPDSSGFMVFVGATGFDPRYDLQYILAATSAASTGSQTSSGNQTLIVGVGAFVPSKIIAAATLKGATVTQYKGATILSGSSKNASGTPTGLAFLDNQTIAMGALPVIEGAIDRKNSAAVFSGPLAAQALSASAADQAWFATVTPLSDFLNGKAGLKLGNLSNNNLFQSIEQSSGGVNLSSAGVTVTADLVTASPQNAQAVVNVLQFLVSMLQNNQNNPQAGTLAGATTFSVNGSIAHAVLSLSEQQAEQLVTAPSKSDARPPHQPAPQRQ